MYRGQKVLITGGFGFVGSHLVKHFVKTGAKVYVLALPNADKSLIYDCLDKINTFEVDIQDTVQVEKIVLYVKPDYVFHLASYGVNSKNKDELLSAKINIIGSINLIKPLIKTGCKKLINIGTSSEYGISAAKEDSVLNPVDIYGSTKASATIVLHQIAKEKNIDIVTLRLFGVFGEGEEPHKIFSYVILNLLKNKDVRLTKCEQLRDYMYVENIVDIISEVGLDKNLKNEIFNIASGDCYPLKYYIDLIFEYMNTNKNPMYGALEYRNTERFAPTADISKAKDLLEFKINIPLEEGLKKTIQWYKDNVSKYEYI